MTVKELLDKLSCEPDNIRIFEKYNYDDDLFHSKYEAIKKYGNREIETFDFTGNMGYTEYYIKIKEEKNEK